MFDLSMFDLDNDNEPDACERALECSFIEDIYDDDGDDEDDDDGE